MYNILLTVQQSSKFSWEELYRKNECSDIYSYTSDILLTFCYVIHNSNNNCANGIVLLL